MVSLAGLVVSEHPVGACCLVLIRYSYCSLGVCLGFSILSGCVLFLVGVGGVLVVFSFVVALCPAPVLKNTLNLGFSKTGAVVVLGGLRGLVGRGGQYTPEEAWNYGCGVDVWGGILPLIPFFGLILFVRVIGVLWMCRTRYGALGRVSPLGMST